MRDRLHHIESTGKSGQHSFPSGTDLANKIANLVLPFLRVLSLNVTNAITAASATIATLSITTLTVVSATVTSQSVGSLSVTGAEATSRGTTSAFGTSSATATALSSTVDNYAISGADGIKGVRLPTASAGRRIFIKNMANATLKVYPGSGIAINEIAAGLPIEMTAYTSAFFVGDSTSKWYTCPNVPS